MQILILGMHRSGTSLVSRLTNMMGAYFGPEGVAMEAKPENPKGFWERTDVRLLNDQILRHVGQRWDDVHAFAATDLDLEGSPDLAQRLRNLILGMDAHRPWMVKDPRLCLTLPWWRPLLECPVAIVVQRNPVEIAASLARSRDLPEALALALWEVYTLQLIQNVRDLPHVLVRHADFIADPVEATRALHAALAELGVEGLRLPNPAQIRAFVDERAHRRRARSGEDQERLLAEQLRIARLLEHSSALSEAPVLELSPPSAEILRLNALSRKAEHERDVLERKLELAHERLQEIKPAQPPKKDSLALLEVMIEEGRRLEAAQREEIARLRDQREDDSIHKERSQARIHELERRLGQQESVIQRLVAWYGAAQEAFDMVLESRRFKLGDRLGNLVQRIRRRPLQRSFQDNVQGLILRGRTLVGEAAAGLVGGKALLQVERSLAHASGQRGDMALLTDSEFTKQRAELLKRSQDKRVSVIMPAWNRESELVKAVESLLKQTYPNWELLLVDDGSTDATHSVASRLAQSDDRIRYLRRDHRGVSAARNVGLDESTGEIIAYLDTDNTWRPDFLLFMVHALEQARAESAYCALHVTNHANPIKNTVRKRRFDPNALRVNNYIDLNSFVHTRGAYERHGGFDEGLRRWVDWDLILRYTHERPPCEVPLVLVNYHLWSRDDQITKIERPSYKQAVLNRHLIDWKALEAESRDYAERATIVIPVYGQIPLTRACVRSLYESKAGYDFDVIIVDNGSKASEGSALDDLQLQHSGLGVIHNRENFGFALGCNLGGARARGRFVVFLNNDTEVHPNWLIELIEPLQQREDVGSTGPKLLYPDGTVQAAGMVFSRHSKIPYHIYRGFPSDDRGVCKERTFQALTGACIAMRTSDFVTLRGFDPVYQNGCEDIDLCFRMRKDLGKTSLLRPNSVVTHHEGKSEGRGKAIRSNRELFVERWRDVIVADDTRIYAEDGRRADIYCKFGSEPHGEIAAYVPSLEAEDEGRAQPSKNDTLLPELRERAPRRTLRVGFSSTWHTRGISLHTLQIAKALEEEGFETFIFARWESDRFSNEHPNHHPRVLNAGNDPSPAQMLSWVEDNQLDLVVFMEVHPRDWKRAEHLKQEGVTLVGYENLDILKKDSTQRYAIFDYMLFNSFHAHEVFKSLHPGTPGIVVPWGAVGPAELPELTVREGIRYVHVGGWGGINNRKNTDLLIETFHRARLVSSSLTVYSQVPATAYGSECARIVALNPAIHMIEGTVPDISVAYRAADMLLWPSKREGLGLPIVEALAWGLPVLVSDGYMMKQWLIPERHGVVCPATPKEGDRWLPEMQVDQEALTGILQDLDSDPARVYQMAKNVRRDRALWLWSWQGPTLREQFRRIIEHPGYHPADDLREVPLALRDHERARRAFEQAKAGATLACANGQVLA